MSVTALPVPSKPPKVPNRWVWIDRTAAHTCPPRWCASLVYASELSAPPYADVFMLPGTALAAALAELERASVKIENELDLCDLASADTINAWAVARRAVRELTRKGTNP